MLLMRNIFLLYLAQDLAATLQADIPDMITELVDLGLEVNVNTEDLLTKDLSC